MRSFFHLLNWQLENFLPKFALFAISDFRLTIPQVYSTKNLFRMTDDLDGSYFLLLIVPAKLSISTQVRPLSSSGEIRTFC